MTTSARNRLGAVRASVDALTEDAVAVRRELHRHPELSTEEHRTQALIINWLASIGAEDLRPIADTGVTALVRGALPGPNLLWRADIDALPLEEDTGLAFASETPGAMHACAHDGHTAIALAMASALQHASERLRGSVRFAFQPAEERVGGARRMIREGVLDEPAVDQAYGLHIWSETPVGQLMVQPGPIFAAATHFRIIIRGRGGHASAPHGTIDPIVVAAHAIVALQTIVSRNVDPADTAVLTVGRLEGGVRGNIIPSQVMMSGTVRTFDQAVMDRIVARTDELLAGVSAAFGATYQFDHSLLPAVVNDAECAEIVADAATSMFGVEGVGEKRITGGDDMAYFLERVPGAYFLLGARPAGDVDVYPHHSPKFDFDEACIPLGIELGLRIIERATGSQLD